MGFSYVLPLPLPLHEGHVTVRSCLSNTRSSRPTHHPPPHRASNSTGGGEGGSDPDHVRLAPLRGNLHEWHFTVSGPVGTVYEGGLYHGRILLPADYPASAPRLQMLNPSGRFEVRAVRCAFMVRWVCRLGVARVAFVCVLGPWPLL
jgi:hypothetical protein